MKLEFKKVHGLDFMFTIACFIQSSSLLTSYFVSIARQESWLVVIAGYLICCPIIFGYIKLIEAFPGKNLFDIFMIVYGKYLGKFLCFVYVCFFLILTTLNLSDLSIFVQNTIMPKTPRIALSIIFLLTSAWALYVGELRQMVKYGFVLTMICLFIAIITILLTINLMDLDNFLPVFDLTPKKYIHGINIFVAIPLTEIVIFLMVAPGVDVKKRSFFFYFMGGVIIGCVTILLVVIRDIAVLGNTISLFSLPSFETLRMVSVTQALSRMEILFAFILVTLLFFKITWLYYVSVLCTAHLTQFKDYKQLILIIGALVVTATFVIYPNPMVHTDSSQNSMPFIWPFLEFIIPIGTLFVGKARGLTQKKKSGNQKNKKKDQSLASNPS